MVVKRVLIVEDYLEHAILIEAMISNYLSSISVECEFAENGEQAFEKVKKNKYDLIITDTNMPVMNGIELLTKVKQFCPELKVIVLFSGLASDWSLTIGDIIEKGAEFVMRKDLDNRELMRQIEKVLRPRE